MVAAVNLSWLKEPANRAKVRVIAPAKTPRPVLGRIASEVVAIVAMPSTHDFIGKQGGQPFASTPEQTAVVIKEEIASYARIIIEAGIKYQP